MLTLFSRFQAGLRTGFPAQRAKYRVGRCDMKDFTYFITQILNGLGLGSIYALVALGYSMVYGIVQLINFAHGDIIMVGSYMVYLVMVLLKAPLWVAVLAAVLFCAVAGVVIERVAYHRLLVHDAPRISLLITALGVSIFLQNLFMLVFGSESQSMPQMFGNQSLKLGELSINFSTVLNLIISILMMAGLQMLVKKTKIGKAMTAIAQNQDAAKLMGIDTNKVIELTFVISGVLACIAGTMVAMYYRSIETTMGSLIGTKIFAAAILGGVGMLPGAMVGGILLGIVETMVSAYISTGYRDAISFTILIVVLLFMPNGMFGKKAINKV